jgi:hypothetical protein
VRHQRQLHCAIRTQVCIFVFFLPPKPSFNVLSAASCFVPHARRSFPAAMTINPLDAAAIIMSPCHGPFRCITVKSPCAPVVHSMTDLTRQILFYKVNVSSLCVAFLKPHVSGACEGVARIASAFVGQHNGLKMKPEIRNIDIHNAHASVIYERSNS